MSHRTIAIGDIHGCVVALDALLDAIQLSTSDTLIQLGDAIDRGPDSRAVIESLRSLSQRCTLVFIRGNHEEMLLDALSDSVKLPRWLRNGGTEALQSYGCEEPQAIPDDHLAFLRSSVDYYETQRHIFIHAGYVEGLPMPKHSSLALRWRVMNENSLPHCSGKTMIAGHTAQKSGEILDLGYAKCIDTNCVHGGWLTALDVESGQVWQADQLGSLRKTG